MKVAPRGPQRDHADQQRHDRGGAGGEAEMGEAVGETEGDRDADRVRADAEEGGVAEADHPAIAEDDVERQRGDGEDHDAGGEIDVEALVQRPGRQRHQREEDERGERDGTAARGHRVRGGNSPRGRKNRMAAISA